MTGFSHTRDPSDVTVQLLQRDSLAGHLSLDNWASNAEDVGQLVINTDEYSQCNIPPIHSIDHSSDTDKV